MRYTMWQQIIYFTTLQTNAVYLHRDVWLKLFLSWDMKKKIQGKMP